MVKRTNVAKLPICPIEWSKPIEKTRHDKIVSLVEQMLSAKKQLASARSEKDKNFYENKCDGLDRQIDALVCDLYGLTKDEIKLVVDAGE